MHKTELIAFRETGQKHMSIMEVAYDKMEVKETIMLKSIYEVVRLLKYTSGSIRTNELRSTKAYIKII